MSSRDGKRLSEISLYTTVDSELYAELIEIVGQKVLQVHVWDEALADEFVGVKLEPEEMAAFDMDIYLADGVFFELYGTLCFTNPESDPMIGLDAVSRPLIQAVNADLHLEDIAVDEDDGLVLILGRKQEPLFYLVVGGWLLEEWNELPDG